MTPVHWLLGWVAAVVGERLYSGLKLEFDEEDL